MECNITQKSRGLFFVILLSTLLLIMIVIPFGIKYEWSSRVIDSLYIVIMIVTVIGIILKFEIPTKSIKINEERVICKKIGKQEKEYLWNELIYKKNKKKYLKNAPGKSYYNQKFGIRTEYVFFYDGKIIFTLNDVENKNEIEMIKEYIINTQKISEEKIIFDGKEVIEVKLKKSKFLDNFFVVIECIVIIIMLLIFIIMKIVDIEIILFLFILLCITLVMTLIQIIKDKDQFIQRVYLVKNEGFYIEKNCDKKFYSFNDVDRAKTEFYKVREPVEHTLILYKDDKVLLQLTDSNSGFYEFLEELKNHDIIK